MKHLAHSIEIDFPGKRILIAGDIVADQFLYGSISRVSREAPVFILRHKNTETRPGAAANAAANVASLGGTPLLVGVVGNDDNGRLLCDSLDEAGVDRGYLVTDDAVSTTTKVRVLSGHRHSARQQVIRIDYENRTGISDDIRGRIRKNFAAAADRADAIIISDYNYGVANRELFEDGRRIALERKIPLLIDSRFRLQEFPGATSATPNQEEAEQLLGQGFSTADCCRLCRELEFDSLVVTCGSRGMIVADSSGQAHELPAVGPKEAVDVTGAGDTVIAAYSLGLASRLSFLEAATVANHAGGIVVMKKGTATVTSEELLASIATIPQAAMTDSA